MIIDPLFPVFFYRRLHPHAADPPFGGPLFVEIELRREEHRQSEIMDEAEAWRCGQRLLDSMQTRRLTIPGEP